MNSIRSNYQPHPDAASWFVENIHVPVESIQTPVNGKLVHMLAWNPDAKHLPVLMFIHGFGAHAHWWSFLAPFFTEKFRVYSLDLPSFGDSESPLQYHDNVFAEGIIGCIETNQLKDVTLVAHSFGGAQSIRAMGLKPELFHHGIIVDTNVRLPPEPLIRRLKPKGAHKTSPTQDDCISRFKLMPPQPNYLDWVVHFIGFHSCTGNDVNGWHWKSDPNCINFGEIEDPSILEAPTTKIDMIYGSNSFLNVENKPQRVMDHFKNPGKLLFLKDTGHHIMAERPLELVSSIQSLF